MKNKIVNILFCVFLILSMTGCGKHGELHEYDDFVSYVNNMSCSVNDKFVPCNLRDKFEVVHIYDDVDYKGDPMRTYTFKLKDDDFSFDVISSYSCTNGLSIDGSCYDYTCYLNGFDYYEKAEKYHINKFNEEFDFNNKIQGYPHYLYDESKEFSRTFNVITVEDVNFVIDYFNSYLDYANALDYKFFDFNYSLPFSINFAYYGHEYGGFYVGLDENNKYIFKFRDEYYPDDGKLETYIHNIMDKNGITFK